ncbi:hypothetical protein [Sphingomonas sp. Y38-1Y]|uniref:hypothetical protein n=1 Tax=Sphingomonas sp. Y38-1Y TaxID=3078265 RepID=UPI0028E1DE03|nr:hypothetical protein [Sphingomonas sp. Y38-1Y]
MAGLYLTRADDGDRSRARLDAAAKQYDGHGFGQPTPIAFAGWTGLHYGYVQGGPATWHRDGNDLIAVAGTLTFDGRIGAAALAGLLDSYRGGDPDWSRLGGQFSALIVKDGRAFVFCDWFAAHQLHHDIADTLFSTSLTAALVSIPRLTFDTQGVYEYAFNVVPIGDDTVFAELKTLGPGIVAELTADGIVRRSHPRPLPDIASDEPIADRLARHRDALSKTLTAHLGHFRTVHAPLSGGLDSRLLLAGLRAEGVDPALYVYGTRDDEDVVIAEAMAAELGFGVEWVDKDGVFNPAPDQFADVVAANFRAWDALPTFGNIFDNGGAVWARNKRHAGGALAASGGCGEIWRDFFFLPDRPLSARTVAHSFFARFDPRDTTEQFDSGAFLERIEGKIAAAIGAPSATAQLSRQWVEHAYPRVRCRSLFGREISLESRQGAYAMPFLDQHVVAEAMKLPMLLKQAGAFEAQLLTAIDPVLAAQPSAYGHDFASGPDRRHRWSEWSSRARPTWLRRRSYALQRRIRPMGDEHGGLLSPDYMRRVIDLDMPLMQRFFRVDRVGDSAVWRRLAALEYLGTWLGTRLA